MCLLLQLQRDKVDHLRFTGNFEFTFESEKKSNWNKPFNVRMPRKKWTFNIFVFALSTWIVQFLCGNYMPKTRTHVARNRNGRDRGREKGHYLLDKLKNLNIWLLLQRRNSSNARTRAVNRFLVSQSTPAKSDNNNECEKTKAMRRAKQGAKLFIFLSLSLSALVFFQSISGFILLSGRTSAVCAVNVDDY